MILGIKSALKVPQFLDGLIKGIEPDVAAKERGCAHPVIFYSIESAAPFLVGGRARLWN